MPSLYTFTTKPITSETSGSKDINRFGNQPVDGGRIAIQSIANGIQTTDATPVNSPITLVAGGSQLLNTPQSAITLTINNTGSNPMDVSEVSSGSSYTLNAGQTQEFDCANMAEVHTSSTSGTTYSFFYQIV